MYRQSIQFPAKDIGLREDVHALGILIGEMLKDQGGAEFFNLVEGDRLAALERREQGSVAALGSDLRQRTEDRSPASATDLTRAFAIWFQAVNTAEKVHRVRRRRQYLSDSRTAQPGGIADCVARLQRDGLSLEKILELIASMSIEPVFTAHPTESTRRTLLRKQQHIAQDLLDRLNPALSAAESETLWARVRLEITSIWQTEDHPREGLTVADEREHVLFYLIEILYRVVPLFYEEIEAALAQAFSVPLESLDVPSILHFGSCVGGDMDGNPDVHGKTIRETLHRHQQLIVSTYFAECAQLAETLSQSANRVGISAALAKRIEVYGGLLPGAQELAPARHDRQPYRTFFGQIRERLKATYDGSPNGYSNSDELLADIQLAADSLTGNRGRHAGYFLVRRFIRRVRTFGFHLATLNVTQHAHVHDQVIAQGLSLPHWPTLPGEERLRHLRDLLARDQGPSTLDAIGRRSLWVFDAIVHARHKFGGRAIGEYIVSGARGPEDVLAVLLLGRWADITDKRTGECPLDVAPLLESIGSLEEAGGVLRRLYDEPAYRSHLAARDDAQVVMIGYSDPNKEGGIAASRWALQVAQAQLLDAARDCGIRMTLFHGRGGTPSRGGGRTEDLVEAMPHGALHGVLRLTEQGEVVNQSYGLRPIAMRTLERTFSAVALATAHSHEPAAKPLQMAAMRTLAAHSLRSYRTLVHDDAGFVDYFRAATPLDVIERMHIGSRPAARAVGLGLDALRAIPWVFAWTQSRHMLPGWFGFGSGLEAALAEHGWPLVRDMVNEWPFFAHLLDDVEAMLARTDLAIAAHYDALAGEAVRSPVASIHAEFALTVRLVLELRGTANLLDGDPTLQRSITLRNPYIDPMHLMQVDLLQRWRATGRRDQALFEALRATISGIAQGLQATG
jgi:phosphoenolpyruvate carboxylase